MGQARLSAASAVSAPAFRSWAPVRPRAQSTAAGRFRSSAVSAVQFAGVGVRSDAERAARANGAAGLPKLSTGAERRGVFVPGVTSGGALVYRTRQRLRRRFASAQMLAALAGLGGYGAGAGGARNVCHLGELDRSTPDLRSAAKSERGGAPSAGPPWSTRSRVIRVRVSRVCTLVFGCLTACLTCTPERHPASLLISVRLARGQSTSDPRAWRHDEQLPALSVRCAA